MTFAESGFMIVPRALRKLQLSFHETHLTHFGGMVLLQRFCNKLGLRRLLQRSLRMSRRNPVVTISTSPRTIHDFGGFPQEL